MKDLPHIRGRHYIAGLIAEGEHERQDFKYMISDARKIARSISAFANADGGHLLIGVKDNGTVAGVRNEEDVFVVEQAAERYCDPPQQVEFTAFNVDNGTVVIRASVTRSSRRPVRAQDVDGRWTAYYRVADENIQAHPLMVRAWQLQDAGGCMIVFGERESRLLELLDDVASGMTSRDIALGLHMSKSVTDDLIVRLAAIGTIGFCFDGSQFLIVRADSDETDDKKDG